MIMTMAVTVCKCSWLSTQGKQDASIKMTRSNLLIQALKSIEKRSCKGSLEVSHATSASTSNLDHVAQDLFQLNVAFLNVLILNIPVLPSTKSHGKILNQIHYKIQVYCFHTIVIANLTCQIMKIC